MDLLEKSIHTLELPKVLELLANEAVCPEAKEMCRTLRPATTLFECQRLLNQTDEAYLMTGTKGSPSFYGLKNVSPALERADKGGFLNPSELMGIASLLREARVTRDYCEAKEEKSSLYDYFSRLKGNKSLEDKINTAILSEEEISDHASSELYQLRRQIRTASSKVRDVLNKIVTSQSYSKMLQDSIITQRGGRFVVPIKAEYRSAFPGLVHDISSSGATLFIEPSSVVELNNNIRVLEGKEQAEIERILAELSADVALFAAVIAEDYQILLALDFIFARAKLAYKMRGSRPDLLEEGQTKLERARHPLLHYDTAVPITFTIGGGTDTVIITGPNTGGKTVSIKTLGLLCLMSQCGLFTPVSGENRVVIFDKVLADIGDEQSIEQSLSTFSSHMKNIVEILKVAQKGTLVLLDELGAGTDPVEGAAIAVSIIEHLRGKGCMVAATTHYAELKVYALETVGVENASCEFDVQTLMPTYRLIFGIPGKSNAFAISKRLGLEDDILAFAQTKIDTKSREFEDVISKLEEKRQDLEAKISIAEARVKEAEELNHTARTRLNSLESEREKLVEDAKKKAQEIIANARAVGEMTIKDIHRLKEEAAGGADVNLSEARKAYLGELGRAEKEVHGQQTERKTIPLPRALVPGDNVEIVATKTPAVVLEVDPLGEKIKLQAGILKITVSQDELSLRDHEKKPEKKPVISKPSPPSEASTRLDLRGQNGDEAIMEVDRFIDSALRLKLETVTIIHGKGTGVLRQRVQSHLKQHPSIKSYRLGTFGEGEAGVTVATLRF